MHTPESITVAIANMMEGVGHGISEQLYNALEAEFTAANKTDQEGNLDAFLVALDYALTRVCITRSNR